MKAVKLPSGSYRVQKSVDGVRYSITFDHKPSNKEITIAIAQIMEDSSKGEKGSFELFANKYIDNRSNVVSPATTRTYQTKLKQISKEFKTLKLYEITNESVQVEINKFSVDHAPKTVKTTYGFIASVLGEYRPNMSLKVKLPQAIKKDEYEPTTEDIKRILKDAEGTPYHIAYQLGVMGMRRGEICACLIEDLKGNELWIHRSKVYIDNEWIVKESPKTDASNRKLPLPESLADEIRESGAIFDGHPNALNKAIHRAQKRLGIPEFKFHALRSYFASYASSMNIPEADILAIGGWSTPSIMRSVYRKSMEESKRESFKKIADSLF